MFSRAHACRAQRNRLPRSRSARTLWSNILGFDGFVVGVWLAKTVSNSSPLSLKTSDHPVGVQ